MRMLFLLLVFANLAFFAYRYYVTQYAVPDFDPAAQELQPDRIRIVAPEELARLAASRRGAVCIELGPLSTGDVARAEDAVAGLGAGLKIAQRREEPSRWWVYIPPLPSRQAAAQRVAELKRQGIEDSSVVSDDAPWRNAISLGVFRSEEAANSRAESLRKRGVAGFQVAAREGSGARVYLQLRDAPEPVRLRFVDLRDGFPGSDVRDCPSG